MSLRSRLEGWVLDGFGSWWHFACLVAGLAVGYLTRPWVDCWASAFRLWWRSQQ